VSSIYVIYKYHYEQRPKTDCPSSKRVYSVCVLCILYTGTLMTTHTRVVIILMASIQLLGCASIDHIRASNSSKDTRMEVYVQVYSF
jgi:hypothetical protein